jgi:hypothetical protein
MEIVEWIVIIIGLPIVILMAWVVDHKDRENLDD